VARRISSWRLALATDSAYHGSVRSSPRTNAYLLIDFRIEPEGREAILAGLKRLSICRKLYSLLSEEPTIQDVDLELELEKLVDVEIKAAAGFFYGLCCSIDLKNYLKTFGLCFLLEQACLADIERRRATVCVSNSN
jgi:hypothetical protein